MRFCGFGADGDEKTAASLLGQICSRIFSSRTTWELILNPAQGYDIWVFHGDRNVNCKLLFYAGCWKALEKPTSIMLYPENPYRRYYHLGSCERLWAAENTILWQHIFKRGNITGHFWKVKQKDANCSKSIFTSMFKSNNWYHAVTNSSIFGTQMVKKRYYISRYSSKPRPRQNLHISIVSYFLLNV